MNEMIGDAKHTGNSKDQICNTSVRTVFPVIKINRVILRSLIFVEVKSAVDSAQREEMRSKFRNLVEETTCDVITTDYCAATDDKKDSSFLFVEIMITEMIHHRVRDETFNQSCKRWSQSDPFLQAFIEMIVNAPGFIAPIAAFVMKRVIYAVEEDLN